MGQKWQISKLSKFKKEYEDLIVDNFTELYTTMKNKGHIPEEVYDRLGFIQDTNYDGDEVEKPDGISQEMRHGTKIPSNGLQRDSRKRNE